MDPVSYEYKMIEFLYNINDLRNLESIFMYGLLSKNSLINLGIATPIDLSDHEVQKIRETKKVPNHAYLHDYANLYIDARNPMMYRISRNRNIDDVCVICVDKKVLDIEGTIVSDRNAAAEIALFDAPKEALKHLDFPLILAKYWKDDDYLIEIEKKSKKCAEVLVYNSVPIQYLVKIKVATKQAKSLVEEFSLGVPIEIDKNIFFQ
ncbi:DUF4433 domain-containing protein [Tannockella kyphosi]|uniref:DUF4433 domain-containing protein n=1 Tax=Tannockella kyphosi TaxID=2899121 RepID=UPI002011A580|nr:DUF4433 domain-containing protein [Tannockella kyphosi]